jgi:hypothetical protein
MPDEIGHLSRHLKMLRYCGHKEIRRQSLEKRTSGAEALSGQILCGTAEPVPFVQ